MSKLDRPTNWAPVTGESRLSWVDHFRRRVLQDAYAEASAAYWRRRAQQFEAARPRVGDFPGQATAADLADQDARLAASAAACRHRASLGDITIAEFNDALEDLVSEAVA